MEGGKKKRSLDSGDFKGKSKKSFQREEDVGRYEWGTKEQREEEEKRREEKEEREKNKQLPTTKKSGLLEKERRSNEQGVEMKYVEPKEACVPSRHWYLFPFKGEEELEKIPVFQRSFFLFGRDRMAVDICIEHPSCSKQHAVIQYRKMENAEGKIVVK